MRSVAITKSDGARHVCNRAWLAERVGQRLRGLLLRPHLQAGEGMLFPGVCSVHTFGMRYSLDIVFLSADLTIVEIHEQILPWKIVFGPPGCRHTLELAPARARGTALRVGDRLGMYVSTAQSV